MVERGGSEGMRGYLTEGLKKGREGCGGVRQGRVPWQFTANTLH